MLSTPCGKNKGFSDLKEKAFKNQDKNKYYIITIHIVSSNKKKL